MFLKVVYQPGVGEPHKIIWINLMTLLPIRYHKEDNRFYSDVEQTDLNPAIPIIGGGDPPASDDTDDGVSFL